MINLDISHAHSLRLSFKRKQPQWCLSSPAVGVKCGGIFISSVELTLSTLLQIGYPFAYSITIHEESTFY